MVNNKILIITYYWPPSGGSGVQRWLSFSNSLVNMGYDVTVLTIAGHLPPLYEKGAYELTLNEAKNAHIALHIYKKTSVKVAVQAAKSGQVQYRAEKTGIVQAGVGKVSFGSEKLIENVKSFIDAVQRARPSGAKGTFIKKVSLSSTMGAGLIINI